MSNLAYNKEQISTKDRGATESEAP